jgi:hypothetical protein
MKRVRAMVFALRGARIRRQLAALQRRANLRPYTPSQHLVPCYPLDPVTMPADHLAPWFVVAAVVAAFLAGGMAVKDGQAAAAVAAPACSPSHNDQ